MSTVVVPDTVARDALLAWFRGEFAAANAIIDALCSHLAQMAGENVNDYASVFIAIHRRRMNWIDILQMQKYYSIADVVVELKKVVEAQREKAEFVKEVKFLVEEKKGPLVENVAVAENEDDEEEPDSEITEGGSQGTYSSVENIEICSNHEECNSRPNQMKLRNGFIARELVKGHMVNVVKGLKLYEDVFTGNELSRLNDFVNDLHNAGRNGELPGETFKIFNQQIKGNKRELIQFGEPIFKVMKEDALNMETRNNVEQIPPLLQNIIDHLVQWHLIPIKMPNSCIINFFDEGEYSQPYLKPPHVDEPVVTIFLSDSTMAFGCTLASDNEGNYKAPQVLSLKKGSVLVMRGNSSNMAAHAMCSSPTKRVAITFFKVHSQTNQTQSMMISPHRDGPMTKWQPGIASPHSVAHSYYSFDTLFNVGVMYAPVPIMPMAYPMALNPQCSPRGGGTGVFMPWTDIPRKHTKHLPPGVQNGCQQNSPDAKNKTRFTSPNIISGTVV